MKENLWKGYWWLPNDEQRKIPGELSYLLNKGIVLSLIGKLEVGIREDFQFIHGITDKGKKNNLV